MKNKQGQPIKNVSYQEIYHLHDLLEQLASWKEPLKLLAHFFSDTQRPVNKQKIAKEYYAQSQIFKEFHSTFKVYLQETEEQLVNLRRKDKV